MSNDDEGFGAEGGEGADGVGGVGAGCDGGGDEAGGGVGDRTPSPLPPHALNSVKTPKAEPKVSICLHSTARNMLRDDRMSDIY